MPKLAVTGGNEESGAMVFGNRALTGKPLRVACVKMETESIRPHPPADCDPCSRG